MEKYSVALTWIRGEERQMTLDVNVVGSYCVIEEDPLLLAIQSHAILVADNWALEFRQVVKQEEPIVQAQPGAFSMEKDTSSLFRFTEDERNSLRKLYQCWLTDREITPSEKLYLTDLSYELRNRGF